jgi:hypothetical protein
MRDANGNLDGMGACKWEFRWKWGPVNGNLDGMGACKWEFWMEIGGM